MSVTMLNTYAEQFAAKLGGAEPPGMEIDVANCESVSVGASAGRSHLGLLCLMSWGTERIPTLACTDYH